MKTTNNWHLFLDGLTLLLGAAVFVIGFDLSLGPLKKGKEADPLITAVMQENVDKVKSNLGEDVYQKLAGCQKPASFSDYLRQRTAQKDEYGRTALMWLAYANYSVDPATPGMIERTLAWMGIHSTTAEEKTEATPLQKADAKRITIMPVLLEAGADVNARDNDGWTALMWASWSGLTKIAAALADHKADVNVLDRQGNSALTVAAMRGNAAIVKLLLEKGAKATGHDLETVCKAAEQYPKRKARYDEILAMLKKAGEPAK